MTMSTSTPPPIARDDGRYRRARADFRARCATARTPCWLCGEPIDYSIRQRPGRPVDPRGFEVDHVKPWATHPNLRLEPSNWCASHSRCNRERARTQQRNDPTGPAPRDLALGLGTPSRAW